MPRRCRWRAHFGPNRNIRWNVVGHSDVRQRQAMRRMVTLKKHEATQALVKRLEALAEGLWEGRKHLKPDLRKSGSFPYACRPCFPSQVCLVNRTSSAFCRSQHAPA